MEEVEEQEVCDGEKGKKDPVMSDVLFSSLKDQVSELTMNAINSMGLTRMTHIQAETFPHLINGRNLIGASKTGSGKTLAFLIPAIEILRALRFKPRNGTGCIVLSPSRELAIQTHAVLKKILKFHSLTHCLLMGGGSRKTEEQTLAKGANIIIATPGRLLDHLENTKPFLFQGLACLIIDEADRILDHGFEDAMKLLIKILPNSLYGSTVQRQTVLFSATQSDRIENLVKLLFLSSPIFVDVRDQEPTVAHLDQGIVICDTDKRFHFLFTFLRKYINKSKIMVFFNSCDAVKYYHRLLNYINVPVMCIHGRQDQDKRTRTYYQFLKAENATLLCTDVAARGWDIRNVHLIVQFDPPSDPTEYIHRVGRTARGEDGKGRAILVLREEELEFTQHLLRAKIPLTKYEFAWNKVETFDTKLQELVDTSLKKLAKDAFKGYVRAYNSHKLKDVFDINTLDLEKLAFSFGLKVVPTISLGGIPPKRHRQMVHRKLDQRSNGFSNNGYRKMHGTTGQDSGGFVNRGKKRHWKSE